MAIKDVLVYLDASEAGERRLRLVSQPNGQAAGRMLAQFARCAVQAQDGQMRLSLFAGLRPHTRSVARNALAGVTSRR